MRHLKCTELKGNSGLYIQRNHVAKISNWDDQSPRGQGASEMLLKKRVVLEGLPVCSLSYFVLPIERKSLLAQELIIVTGGKRTAEKPCCCCYNCFAIDLGQAHTPYPEIEPHPQMHKSGKSSRFLRCLTSSWITFLSRVTLPAQMFRPQVNSFF